MSRYKNIDTENNYNWLLATGWFWEFHPELSGNWDKDKELINKDKNKDMKDKFNKSMWFNEAPQKVEHYKTSSIDVIDFCKVYDLSFNRGNIVKYVCRAGKKQSEIDDLKKAKDYLEREIAHLENNK